jgi:TM2 domain-containing membrane protein YozV
VLAFDWKTASGVISGDDGYRYDFQSSDWVSEATPEVGTVVDFEKDGSYAKKIYVSPGASPASALQPGESKRLAAGILAILFGILGVHKFYLGYSQTGIIMLVVSIAGAIIILPSLIVALVGIIEGVVYLTKSDEEFKQIYVEGQKPWF